MRAGKPHLRGAAPGRERISENFGGIDHLREAEAEQVDAENDAEAK